MAYKNITIGTEQEISGGHVVIANEDGSPVRLDWDSKVIAFISMEGERLVNVTADTQIGREGRGTHFQLELSTTPAGNNDVEGWRKRKKAIELFVKKYIVEEPCLEDGYYIASQFAGNMQEGEETYHIEGKNGDGRKFYFYKADSKIRFYNHLTVGIGREELIREFEQEALWDNKRWGMSWMKDLSKELRDPLEIFNPASEEKFMYSYIGSVFDWSAKLCLKIHPDYKQGTVLERNHTDEKNCWNVLPRTPVYEVIDYLKANAESVYTFLRSREFNGGTSPEKTEENQIYTKLINEFWKLYDSGEKWKAEYLLRAGVIFNIKDQYLFEFRSVLNKIENIYESSASYIYK